MQTVRSVKELRGHVPQQGKLRWIGLRPEKRGDITVVRKATLVTQRGIQGDRLKRKGTKRQVSLIQKEHLAVIGKLMGERAIKPERLRRNLVVSGFPLNALRKGMQFRIGDALLEWSESCDPCSRMEEELGEGGFAAMTGMGGILARVIEGSEIKVGDPISLV